MFYVQYLSSNIFSKIGGNITLARNIDYYLTHSFPYIKSLLIYPQDTVNDGIPFIDIFGLSSVSKLIYLLPFAVRNRKEDPLIHIQSFNIDGLLIGLFFKLIGWKLILHSHGSDLEKWGKNSKIHKYIAKKVFVKADAVFYASNRLKKIGNKIFRSSKGEYIPNFVHPSFSSQIFNSKIVYNPRSINLVFTGRIEIEKGIIDLIEAMKLIKDSLFKNVFKIHLIGTGTGLKRADNLVKKYELGTNIVFHGKMSQKMIIEIYKVSNFIILPSHSEALPISILEGMVSGLPIISTKVGELSKIVKESGAGILINKINSPSEIFKTLINIQKINTQQYNQMRTKTIMYGKKYSSEHFFNILTHKKLI
ncbi:MAG: D-inositol 3-phosphate glycosyltransferase [Candidatus Heimdallarchaeota archaeon LC_2]|nr:MAG: D-inositol 3-phosphate glycosyltransferase [Candidatus Heimdallarchaeota archaeon LC_2]